MNKNIKLIFALTMLVGLSACGSSKKNFAMKVHSDPLGAYALMQVRHKGDEDPEWVFLGPTPIVINKGLRLNGDSSVSLKVIRPG